MPDEQTHTTITMFLGQNVDDMTREEAIKAVKLLGAMYQNLVDSRDLETRFFSQAESCKWQMT